MEEICNRFSLINEQINEMLDDQTLARCKEASRSMCYIISNQKGGRFFWTRMIRYYINENISPFEEDWKIVIKTKSETLKKFAFVVEKFYNYYLLLPDRHDRSWSPMHIAAERGDLDLCKYFAGITKDKNPRCSD